MPKPICAGNPSIKRAWFSGSNSTGPKAPQSLALSGATALSRNLLLSDPEFSGCHWPLEGQGADQRYCCAPAKGRFCAPHSKSGVIPMPASGRGSAAEFIRGLERYL